MELVPEDFQEAGDPNSVALVDLGYLVRVGNCC